MNKIEFLVIHYSASNFGDVKTIRKWHLERGWRDIGYNAVILNGHRKHGCKYNMIEDGMIEIGRGLDFDKYISSKEKGAHTLGYNHNSVGVCYIGAVLPTPAQENTISLFCKLWKVIIPEIKIIGHKEVNKTDCPGFDVQEWLEARKLK